MSDKLTTVKAGFKTRELWMTVISTILLAVWPAFPIQAFYAVMAWVIARAGQKAFGFVDAEGNNKWTSTEFLVSIVFAVVSTIFPGLPMEALYAVIGWTGTRAGVKIGDAVKAKKVNYTENIIGTMTAKAVNGEDDKAG